MKINLSVFGKIAKEAEKIILTGNTEDVNTFDNLQNVVPLSTDIKVKSNLEYTAIPMSLTVIRIKTVN